MLCFTIPVVALLARAFAAPTSKNDVEVIWTLDKSSSNASLRAWTTDYSVLLGEACNSTLNTGNFKNSPLTFKVDENGYGTLQYGPQSYNVSAIPAASGGIVCHKRYNSLFARVNCIIPYQGSSQEPLSIDENAACFPGEVLRMWQSANTNAASAANTAMAIQTSPNKKRSDCGDAFESAPATVLVGDGNPHQNWYNQQMTPNIECSNTPGCSAAYSETKGYTFGWSADISPIEWISGGFSVETSFEATSQLSCNGNPGDIICLWHQTVYTAYTVQNVDGCNNPMGKPFVIESPNTNQDLQYARQFYCVDGPCRSVGEGYWDKTGPAGGPPA